MERMLLELMVYCVVGMAKPGSCGELVEVAMIARGKEVVGLVIIASCEELVEGLKGAAMIDS